MAQDERCAIAARHRRLTDAYRSGDLAAVKAELGWPETFPNTSQPMELACGDAPIVTAIIYSPIRFIRQLLDLGADPKFDARDGFPTLFCAIDSDREDRSDLVRLLLHYGADPNQRGINDGTALHYAVWRRYPEIVALMLKHGADTAARTRIDDYSTALEDAQAMGFDEAVALIEAHDRTRLKGG
jgi:ankyrin repeat protein